MRAAAHVRNIRCIQHRLFTLIISGIQHGLLMCVLSEVSNTDYSLMCELSEVYNTDYSRVLSAVYNTDYSCAHYQRHTTRTTHARIISGIQHCLGSLISCILQGSLMHVLSELRSTNYSFTYYQRYTSRDRALIVGQHSVPTYDRLSWSTKN